ncbi:MAG TPA: hypothetical protein VMA95_18920 [Streptosporangiaceae bacterium]|nr:hypothetical protein [Streptosporangiaceae bacterium]
MRHLIGLILAIVLSAALYLAGGWGVKQVTEVPSTQGLIAVGCLVGAGLLLGIFLAVPRVSPLATGLPGLVLLAWSALVIVNNGYAVRYLPLPGSTFTAGFTSLLFSGVFALLGAAMVIPLVIPSRWRRPDADADQDDLDDLDVHAALGLTR